MIDLGTVRPGTTLYIPFATYDSNDPAASVTLTGLATTDIEIYKNGSVTQRSSDAGYALLDTDGIDFDAVTGIHGFSIDLADNTDAGFYAAGAQYWVVVASVTVDAGTVNFIAATFRIGLHDAVLNTTIATLATQTSFTLTAGPAEDDALNGCVVYIHDVASAVQGGFAVILDYTGASKTVTLDAGTTFTAAASDNIMIMPPSNMHYMRSVAQSAVDLKDFADEGYDPATNKVQGVVLTDTVTTYTGNTPQTGDSFARIGAAGASLTDLGGMSTTMKAQVQTEAEDALVTHRLDELLNADSDIDGATPPTVGSVFHELLTKTAGSFTYDQTTDSLEALRDRGDAAWITATGFSTLDAAGVRTAVGLASANLDTQLSTIDTVVDAILLDTGTDGVIVVTNNDKTGYRLSATGVDDIHDEAVDGSTTLRQSSRLWNSALGGKASGLATTSAVYRDLADTKDRITATVDADGNRSAVTRDLT